MDLSEYLGILRRHALAIVAIVVLGSLCGFALARSETPLYKATSSLFVSATIGDNSSDLVQGSVYTQNLMQSYAQLAQLPSVLAPVITDLRLDTTTAELASTISADAPLNTVIIQVTVTNTSPTQAADIANAVSLSLASAAEGLSPKKADGSSSILLKQVAKAAPPAHPFSPNTSLLAMVGAAVAALLSVGFFIGRRLVNTRIGSESDLAGAAAVPVLGTVAGDRGRSKRIAGRRVETAAPDAEAFRRLADAVRHVNAELPPKSVVVTSPGPDAGKSYVALNLAVALAERYTRVLLVDADLRHPQVGAACGLADSPGLAEVLAEQKDAHEVLRAWRTIDVMPAGAMTPGPSKLLNSRRMEEVFAKLLADYDFVVCDSTAMTAVADTFPLTRLSDGAVLVARLNNTSKHEVGEVVASIESAGGAVLGMVLNRAAPSRHTALLRPGKDPAVAHHGAAPVGAAGLDVSP
ncbi:MAG: Wzz/FepE/Etk N-terminal domain-containing protein [Specibacter sp.]